MTLSNRQWNVKGYLRTKIATFEIVAFVARLSIFSFHEKVLF